MVDYALFDAKCNMLNSLVLFIYEAHGIKFCPSFEKGIKPRNSLEAESLMVKNFSLLGEEGLLSYSLKLSSIFL